MSGLAFDFLAGFCSVLIVAAVFSALALFLCWLDPDPPDDPFDYPDDRNPNDKEDRKP